MLLAACGVGLIGSWSPSSSTSPSTNRSQRGILRPYRPAMSVSAAVVGMASSAAGRDVHGYVLGICRDADPRSRGIAAPAIMIRTGVALTMAICGGLAVMIPRVTMSRAVDRSVFELPPPTGRYQVATTAWRLTDTSRKETFSGVRRVPASRGPGLVSGGSALAAPSRRTCARGFPKSGASPCSSARRRRLSTRWPMFRPMPE